MEQVNKLAIANGIVAFHLVTVSDNGDVAQYEITPDKDHGCGHCAACLMADDATTIITGVSGLVRKAFGQPDKPEVTGRIDAAGQVSTNPSDKPKPTLH